MRQRRIIVLLCFAMYVGSYATISRIGMSRSASLGVPGYCLVFPDSEFATMLNCACVVAYYPLIIIEDLCGTAEPPSWNVPLFRLSDTAGDPPATAAHPLPALADGVPP